MKTEKNKYIKKYKERKEIKYTTCDMCLYNGTNIELKNNNIKYDDNYCKIMQKNREKDYASICRFFLLSGKVTLIEDNNMFDSTKLIQERYEEYKQCEELGCKICKFKCEDNYCDIISESVNDKDGLLCMFFEPDFNKYNL